MKKLKLLALLWLLGTPALGQTVQQSGTVTPGHAVRWTTNGIIQDAGTAASGSLTSLGVTASGTGICQNSAAITSAGWQQLCLGVTTAGGGTISIQNFGTAPAQGLNFSINGTVVTIPTGGGTIPTIDLPLIDNGLICANGTTGLLQGCFVTVPVTAGGTNATTAAGARTNLGLGTIATQNANAVAITGGTITGMSNPTTSSDVANKSYVDAVAIGLITQPAVRLATAAVLPNTPTYSNGASGVGATLTSATMTALVVDGVTVNSADRILVKNQASTFQNGIYTVTTVGSGAAAWVLTRATDFDAPAEMLAGSYVLVTAGNTNASSSYSLQTTTATVGTTPVIFNQFSAPGVSSIGGTVGPITLSGLSIASSVLTSTALTNVRLAKTANYTLDVADCGKTLALGGNTLFTLTISAASGYDAACQITILNEDSGRGKRISPDGVTSFILYPTQTMALYNSNSIWNVNKQNRWRIPGGNLPVYVNYQTGSDLNDGLISGSPKKTVMGCLTVAAQEVDFNFITQATFSCNLAVGSHDDDGVHFATHALVGAQGGAALLIQGDGGQATISTTGAVPLAFFVNATVQLKNLILTNSAGACLQAGYNTFVDVLSGMEFSTCTGSPQVIASDRATIRFLNDYAVSAGGAYHYLAQGGGKIDVGAITVTGVPTFNYLIFAYASQLSGIVSGATFTGFAGSTGVKAQADFNSIIVGAGGCTTFPGLTAAVTLFGGQCP